jgi:bis(5'-nucleosyl)-tetraphosphatase (symmetrical)
LSTWAIGDIQGCFEPLQRLLKAIEFAPDRDRVLLLGDLVNRGPDSLSVLRWASSSAGVEAVLGNHDLHLVAAFLGVRDLCSGDTLDEVLAAPDRDTLLSWLRHRPLLVCEGQHVLVHAALHPSWSLFEAKRQAQAVEEALRGEQASALLESYYGAATGPPTATVSESDRLSHSLAVLTRLRCLSGDGTLSFDFSGTLDDLPPDRVPWWRAPHRKPADFTVLFGHWAAIGVHREPGICGLDSGCVWGRRLSAYCLEDGRIEQVEGWQP